jgi:hypothetical protein
MGMKMGNIQAFDASGKGSKMAFESLSKNMSMRRDKKRRGEDVFNDDFFTDKEAEEDRKKGEGKSGN